jgi:hypothetical protein
MPIGLIKSYVLWETLPFIKVIILEPEKLGLGYGAQAVRLRAVYERFGFRHHSDRQVGPYFVSRYEQELPLDHRRV